MNRNVNAGVFQSRLSDRDFERLSRAIKDYCGIRLPPGKQTLLEGRLRKRLRELGMSSFDQYCSHLFSQPVTNGEFQRVIDLVTTNKTDFFRESQHFDLLKMKLAPELMAAGLARPSEFRAWSAGCSSGEEAYTTAMVLAEYARENPGFNFSVLATDICTDVLHHGRRGVYREDLTRDIPPHLRQRYLMWSRDRSRRQVRIVPELRGRVRFRRYNLLDGRLLDADEFHVIFCRNVIIYFDRATQERILQGLCRHLATGGFLLMGHSETLNGLDLPVQNVGATVYRKI